MTYDAIVVSYTPPLGAPGTYTVWVEARDAAVKVPGLASHVLGQCCKRLAGDWQELRREPTSVNALVEECLARLLKMAEQCLLDGGIFGLGLLSCIGLNRDEGDERVESGHTLLKRRCTARQLATVGVDASGGQLQGYGVAHCISVRKHGRAL